MMLVRGCAPYEKGCRCAGARGSSLEIDPISSVAIGGNYYAKFFAEKSPVFMRVLQG